LVAIEAERIRIICLSGIHRILVAEKVGVLDVGGGCSVGGWEKDKKEEHPILVLGPLSDKQRPCKVLQGKHRVPKVGH
jgi:hypothetical protein